MKLFRGEPEMLLPTTVITNREEIKPRTIANTAMIAILLGWNGEANLSYFKEKDGISSLEDGVIVIHKLWENVNDKYKGKFYHPIEPIVGAYLREMTAKHISAEHDRKYPIAIISSPMGSIRDVKFADMDTFARLPEFATPESITQVDQLPLDIEQTPQTVLPDVMYLDIASSLKIVSKTRKGAVSHTLRILFEALMALEPSQTMKPSLLRSVT